MNEMTFETIDGITICYINGKEVSRSTAKSVGTTVIANPELVGDEADLTGLQVDNTKYKVPSGGSGDKLYRHYIRCVSLEGNDFTFDVITTKSDEYTVDSLAQYLEDKPEIPCIEYVDGTLYFDKVSGGTYEGGYYLETYNQDVSVSTDEGYLYDNIIEL